MIFSDKKGLFLSLLVIIVIIFVFAVVSVIATFMWNQFNSGIQSLDSSVADNSTKQQIDNLGTKIGYLDKIFTFLFIALFIGYVITAFTLPVEGYWYFVIFAGSLFILTFIGMILSNTWAVFIENPLLSLTAGEMGFTGFILTSLPYFTFFIGLFGGVIFYMRAKQGGGNVDAGFGGGEEF
jgi:hypothetical protein